MHIHASILLFFRSNVYACIRMYLRVCTHTLASEFVREVPWEMRALRTHGTDMCPRTHLTKRTLSGSTHTSEHWSNGSRLT
jgi:hypothetical protein